MAEMRLRGKGDLRGVEDNWADTLRFTFDFSGMRGLDRRYVGNLSDSVRSQHPKGGYSAGTE
jgi:hypothetical protein